MLSNNKTKKITALKNKKSRDRYQQFIVEGFRQCEEAILSEFPVESLLINSAKLASDKFDQIVAEARQKQIKIIEIDENDVKLLSDTIHSQGIFCLVGKKTFSFEKIIKSKSGFIVLVDSGQDPGNLGTIIRTCDWFGVDALFLSENNVDLYNPKVVRSTMGSIFHLPIFENIDLESFLHQLNEQGYKIYTADVNGNQFYHEIDFKAPLALILGNENRGIDLNAAEQVTHSIKIPAYGKAESLNIAMAGAVLISHIKGKLQK